MKEEDRYEITEADIVVLVNSDGNEIGDQASTVEPLRISHND